MWRSELLNLPGGSAVRFGDGFASFVRVPLSGSLPHDKPISSDSHDVEIKQAQSYNCSSLRTSNLLITTSETSAHHLPLFDELSRSSSDIKRFLIALIYDEASKTIAHIRTKSPARLYAAHWPYMIALQDFDASISPSRGPPSALNASSHANDGLPGPHSMELQPELLEVILFEGKAESCRFALPLNFKRGTTRFLIMTEAGVFLVTRRKIYFVSYSAIMSSMSLTRVTTLVWAETDSLLSGGLQPLYDAKYCKSSGSTLVIANPYHLRAFTWDSTPVLCASGRTRVLEPIFSTISHDCDSLRLHADFDENNLISDIRISPKGSLVVVQTQTSIYYWYNGANSSTSTTDSGPRPIDTKMKNLFHGDDVQIGDVVFQESHWQLSLILHVDDFSVIVGSVRCLVTFLLDPNTGKLVREAPKPALNLTSNLAFLAPNSEFVSMLSIHSVIPMHITVNDKGGMAVWDLSQSESDALLAHAQLPLGPVLDAYWLEKPGEIHFVVLHKDRVLHKWVAIRHLLSSNISPLNSSSAASSPSRAEWSDALTSPLLYEGVLLVKDDSGGFVERWVRLRPLVLFIYYSQYSTSNIGVFLLDPHIRLYRDGSSTRFTLANARTKHDFVAPNSIEADRIVHALLFQLSSSHSLASIWTIPYSNAITVDQPTGHATSNSNGIHQSIGGNGLYYNSHHHHHHHHHGRHATQLLTGTLLSIQPVVLKDQPPTFPSTEFLMLTILEHPSIIPLIGLVPQTLHADRGSDPFLMQSHPSLIDNSASGSSSATLTPATSVRLVMPKQLFDLRQLLDLLSNPSSSGALDDSTSLFDDETDLEDTSAFPASHMPSSVDLEALRKMASAFASGGSGGGSAITIGTVGSGGSAGTNGTGGSGASGPISSSQTKTAVSTSPNIAATPLSETGATATTVVGQRGGAPHPHISSSSAGNVGGSSSSIGSSSRHAISPPSPIGGVGVGGTGGTQPIRSSFGKGSPLRRPREVPTGNIPWKTVLRILIGLASGLSTLHHFEFNGHVVPIAHRDIKCENVLIQASSIEDCILNSRCKSVLADFEHAIFTRPFMVPGTKMAHFSDNPHLNKAASMAFSATKPNTGILAREEQVGDERYRDPDDSASMLSHDIYCFGLVAWQLMTLHPLGFGGNAVSQLMAVGGLNEVTVSMLQRWCAPKSYDRPTIDGVMADLTDLALNVVLYARLTTPALNPRLGFVVRKMYAHERIHASLVNTFVHHFPIGAKLKVFYGAPNTGKTLLLETAKELAEFCDFLPIYARAPTGRSSAFGVLLDLAAELYSEKYAAMPFMHMPLEHEQTRLIRTLQTRVDHYHAPASISGALLQSLFTRVSMSGVSLLLMIDDIQNADDLSFQLLTELLRVPFIFTLATALPNTPLNQLAPFGQAKPSTWETWAGTANFSDSRPMVSPTSSTIGMASSPSQQQLKRRSSSSSSSPTANVDGKRSTPSVVNQILKGHFPPYFPDDDSIGKLSGGTPILKSLEAKLMQQSRPRQLSVDSDSSLSSSASSIAAASVWLRPNTKESSLMYEMSELAFFGVDVVLKMLTDRVTQEGGSSSLNLQKWRSAAERVIRYTLGVPAFVKRYLSGIQDIKSFPDDILNRRDSLSPLLSYRYSLTYEPKYLWGSLSTIFKHKLIVASYLDFEFELDDIPALTKRLTPHLPALPTDGLYTGDWDDHINVLYIFLKGDSNGRYRFVSEDTRIFVRSALGGGPAVIQFLKAFIDALSQLPHTEMYLYQQMCWELNIGMRIPKGDDSDLQYVQSMVVAAAICSGTVTQQLLLSHLSAFLLSPASLKMIMENNPDLLISLCLDLERHDLISYALPLLEMPIPDLILDQDVQEELLHLRVRLVMKSDQSARFRSSVQIVMDFLKSHLPLSTSETPPASPISTLDAIMKALTTQEPHSSLQNSNLAPSSLSTPPRVPTPPSSAPSSVCSSFASPSPRQSPSSPSSNATSPSKGAAAFRTVLEASIQDEMPVIVDHLASWLYPSAMFPASSESHRPVRSSPAGSRRSTISSQRSTFVSSMPLPTGPLKWSFGPITSKSRPREPEMITKAFSMIESVLYLSNPTAVDFDGTELEPLVVLYLYLTYAFRSTICPYLLINCASSMARFPGLSLQLFQLAWSLINDWPNGFSRPNVLLRFAGKYARDPEADSAEIRARAFVTLSTDFLYRLETHASLKEYLEEARKLVAMHHSKNLGAEVQLATCQFSLFLGSTIDECAREAPQHSQCGRNHKYNDLLRTFYLCAQALLEPDKAETLAPVLSESHRRRFVNGTEQILPKIDQPLLFLRSDIGYEDVLDYLVHAHTSLLLGEPMRAWKNIRRAFKYALLRRRSQPPRVQVPSFTSIYIASVVAFVSTLELLRSTTKSKRDRLRKTIDANAQFLASCAPVASDPNSASARIFGTFAFHACGLVPTTLRLIETIKLVVKVLISHSKLNQESPLIAPTQLPTFLHHYNTSVASILPYCIEGISRSTIKTLASFFGELGMKLGFLSSTHHVSQFVLLASETYNCYADLKCYTRLRLLENSASFVPYLAAGTVEARSRVCSELSPTDYTRMFIDLAMRNPTRSSACTKLLRDALDIAERKAALTSLPKLLGGGSPAHVVYGLAGIQEVLQLFHDRIDYEVVIRPEQAVRSEVPRAVFVQFLLWCILAFDHVNRSVDDFFSPLEMKLMIGFLDARKEALQSESSNGLGNEDSLSWTSPALSMAETSDLRWDAPLQRHEERLPETMDMLLISSERFRNLLDETTQWSPLPYHLAQFIHPLMPHILPMQPVFKFHESRDIITLETYRAFKVTWAALRPLKFSEPTSFTIVYDHEKKGILSQSLQQIYGSDIHIYMLRSIELLWTSPKESSHVLIHESCWDDSFTPLLEVHQSRHPRNTYVFVSEKASTSSKPMFHITSFRQNVAIDIEAFHAQPIAPLLLPTDQEGSA